LATSIVNFKDVYSDFYEHLESRPTHHNGIAGETNQDILLSRTLSRMRTLHFI